MATLFTGNFSDATIRNVCVETPGLYFLQYSFSIAQSRTKDVNRMPITTLGPGHSIFVDNRTFGQEWYQAEELPDMFTIWYVDKWTITSWKKEPFKLFAYSDVFNAHFILNHEGVMKWGRWFALEDHMVESSCNSTLSCLHNWILLGKEVTIIAESVSCILFLMEDLVMIVRTIVGVV